MVVFSLNVQSACVCVGFGCLTTFECEPCNSSIRTLKLIVVRTKSKMRPCVFFVIPSCW